MLHKIHKNAFSSSILTTNQTMLNSCNFQTSCVKMRSISIPNLKTFHIEQSRISLILVMLERTDGNGLTIQHNGKVYVQVLKFGKDCWRS